MLGSRSDKAVLVGKTTTSLGKMFLQTNEPSPLANNRTESRLLQREPVRSGRPPETKGHLPSLPPAPPESVRLTRLMWLSLRAASFLHYCLLELSARSQAFHLLLHMAVQNSKR